MNFCLVSGANDFYFGMMGALAASVARHFAGVPFRVLDFGLTPEQKTFLKNKNWLVAKPAELNSEQHPYALKSEMARYMSLEPDTAIIWLDCDMIAVGGDQGDLQEMIRGMRATGRTLAACRDQGASSIAEFLKSFPSPALAEQVAESDYAKPYFNIGMTVFDDHRFLESWSAASKRHETAKDICFEQNALNAWVRQNPEKFMELDARRWNVHGALLGKTALTAGGVRCDGTDASILHATSPHSSEHREEQVTFAVKGHSFPALIKWFLSVDLRKLQVNYLSSFLRENYDDLLEAGVLTNAVPDKRYTTLTLK
jgi:lipopolysaccharide biosynthesis glycosyltransferase